MIEEINAFIGKVVEEERWDNFITQMVLFEDDDFLMTTVFILDSINWLAVYSKKERMFCGLIGKPYPAYVVNEKSVPYNIENGSFDKHPEFLDKVEAAKYLYRRALPFLDRRLDVNKDLIGQVAECSIGRPGLITGKKKLGWGDAWVGIGLDGKGPWSSRKPRLLSKDEIANLGSGKK